MLLINNRDGDNHCCRVSVHPASKLSTSSNSEISTWDQNIRWKKFHTPRQKRVSNQIEKHHRSLIPSHQKKKDEKKNNSIDGAAAGIDYPRHI